LVDESANDNITRPSFDDGMPFSDLQNSSRVDISLGLSIGDQENETYDPSMLSNFFIHAHMNDVVSDGFVCSVCMKVGMLAYAKNGPDVDEEFGHLPEDLGIDRSIVPNILGSTADVMIFTGEKLYVGDRHVEYNLNSFSGCSGAPVFLLDKQSPEYGNVLAVHAGHKPPSVSLR